ncbi:MAG: glycosyltransferase family 2 protein [Acidimicrobiales bacterium]
MSVRWLLLVAGWSVGWWLLWRVPSVRRRPAVDGAAGGQDPPAPPAVLDVAVVIPARNEELSLPNLLDSLVHQTSRPAEIIVVDDQSDDATAALASAVSGVTVLSSRPLPSGWTGKSWACQQGADAARSPRLVFLDADVVLAPGALAEIVARGEERGGLVSVQPYHRMERPYERLSAVFNIIGFMGVGSASPGRDARASRGAFGPVLTCSDADYRAIGGHASVRGEIVDDVAIAQEFEGHDLPVHVFGGGSEVSFRMYPAGAGQLVEGWSKNFATGAGSVAVSRFLLIGLWVTAMLISVQVAVDALLEPSVGALVVAATVVVAAVLQVRHFLRQLGTFGWGWAIAYPIPLAMFLVVFARSVWLTAVRRQVQWRGRDVPLARSARWEVAAVPVDDAAG